MRDAVQVLIDGRIKISELIIHRLSWEQTAEAYHLLYEPDEALGVIMEWE